MTLKTQDPDVELSLEEVAMIAGNSSKLPQETAHRMTRLIRTDPRCAAHIRTLEELAREAGLDPAKDEHLEEGFEAQKLLDQLLAAEKDHREELRDPDSATRVFLPELVHLARVRAKREGGEGRTAKLLEDLEPVWAVEHARETLVEGLVTQLLEYPPDEAEALLKQAGTIHRHKFEEARAEQGAGK